MNGESLTDREASVAKEILEDVAAVFDGMITYGELKTEVNRRMDRVDAAQVNSWSDRVLGRVARQCHADGLPPLTAVVVRRDGLVGQGFLPVLALIGAPAPATDEALGQAAAEARLDCYRRFGADVPADAVPRPTAVRRRALDAETRQRRADQPRPRCQHCHVELPRSGPCDCVA